jgi:cysteine desulfurase
VPGIVAFGEAAQLAKAEIDERSNHDRRLRDRFESEVLNRIDDVVLNGDPKNRLAHLSNLSFRFIEGEGLLINLDLQGVAVSTGSACSSGTLEPSPVIRALGRTVSSREVQSGLVLGKTIPTKRLIEHSKFWPAL